MAALPRVPLIGLAGLKGSGKDTVASLIREDLRHIATTSLADPIKEWVMFVFDADPNDLWGPSERRKTVLTPDWQRVGQLHASYTPGWASRVAQSEADADDLTNRISDYLLEAESLGPNTNVRTLLEDIGTEIARNQVDSNIWTECARRRIQSFRFDPNIRAVVLTDVRFPDEAAMVREEQGFVWRINSDKALQARSSTPHESEALVFSPEMTAHVTHEIDNNGTIDELARTVTKTLNLILGKVAMDQGRAEVIFNVDTGCSLELLTNKDCESFGPPDKVFPSELIRQMEQEGLLYIDSQEWVTVTRLGWQRYRSRP